MSSEAKETALQLNIRHIALQIRYLVYRATVDIPEREIVQQIAERMDIQLFGQHLARFGPTPERNFMSIRLKSLIDYQYNIVL